MCLAGSRVAHQQQAGPVFGGKFPQEAPHLHEHGAQSLARHGVVAGNLEIVERGLRVVGRNAGGLPRVAGACRRSALAALSARESRALDNFPARSFTNRAVGIHHFNHHFYSTTSRMSPAPTVAPAAVLISATRPAWGDFI